MQEANSLASEPAALAIPPRPTLTALWSERYKRWHEPGTSPISGLAPPAHARFQTGVADPRRTTAGIVTAKTRQLMEADERLIDKIARRWIRNAERGDNRALAMLLDRLEGPVEQRIDATVTSRYVIEEAGTPYVDAAPALTLAASDNMHYVAHCADESSAAPVRGEPKSETGGADPDGGTPSEGSLPPAKIPSTEE